MFYELLVILCLIMLNGFFAAAEIAVLTASRGKLRKWASEGDNLSRLALELAQDPNCFLPTVQVGITIVGTLAAAFTGVRFATELAVWLRSLPVGFVAHYSESLAIAIVVACVSYVSLVVGELVPKRLALQHAQMLARLVAYPMWLLQLLTRPLVWALDLSTRTILTLLRQDPNKRVRVSLEDIQHLIDAGTEEGVLEHDERSVASQALILGDRTVKEVMRPRIDIDALDIDTPSDEVIGAIAMSGFSRIPVCEKDVDHIVGFVYLKDVFLQQYLGRPIDLRRLVRPPLFIPESLSIARLLQLFRQYKTQMAIVLDEYGGTEGMVTLEDVLELLVGEIHDEHRTTDHVSKIVERDDGSWIVDAQTNLYELQKKLHQTPWEEPPPRGVGTVAGLVLALLRRPPQVGDRVQWSGVEIEILAMDDYRIERLLVRRLSAPGQAD